MSGWLRVVGLGPGDPALLTPQARTALEAAEDLVGYGPYLARWPERAGQRRHASDNREERERAALALGLAAGGRRVALVSGGDPGIFGMAATVFEILGENPVWEGLDIAVLPGITALTAAAARLGAPFGHDFCAISLSDNLKPWALIEARLSAAARAGFVIALYNPLSRARPWQLGAAFALLRRHLPAHTPLAFARAISRPDERLHLSTLGEADPARADMATLVIVGSAESRLVPRPGGEAWFYTPRRAGAAEGPIPGREERSSQ